MHIPNVDGMSLAQAAQTYAVAGLQVFPLEPNSALPYGKTHGHLDATDDVEQVERWWTEHPEAGIGLRGTELLIIDVDAPDLATEVFDALHDSGAPMQMTARGVHALFADPGQHYINSAKKVEGVDIRTAEGWIRVAPTIHPRTREPYQWMRTGVVPNIPQPIERLMRPFLRRTPANELDDVNQLILGSGLVLPDVIPTGQRHELLYRYACKLRAEGTPIMQAAALMKAAWERCESKIGYSLQDAMKEIDQAWGAFAPRRDLSLMDGSHASQGSGEEERDQNATRSFVEWPEAWSTEVEDIPWLVDGVIREGKSSLIYSPAKTGKSLLMLQWVADLASGIDPMTKQPREPVHVMYVDYENDMDDIFDRLRDMGYEPHQFRDHLHYLSFPMIPRLDTLQGGMAIRAFAEEVDAKWVLFDTASRTIDGNENDASTWLDWYKYTGMPLKRDGIAFTRLDHSGKDELRDARGSSAKVSDVDSVWRLTVKDNELRLKLKERRQSGYTEGQLILREEDDNGRVRHVHRSELTEHGDMALDFDVLDAELLKKGVGADTSSRATNDAIRLIRGKGMKRTTLLEFVRFRKQNRQALKDTIEDGTLDLGTGSQD